MSNNLSIEGLDAILKTLDDLGKVGDKIGVDGVKKAMSPGLDIIKAKAPKDTEESRNHLKITKVKKYKSGGVWGGMGIDSSNWEECKPLWYQHWGYDNYGGNTRAYRGHVTTNQGWFDEATDSSKDTILSTLEKELTAEIDKILR